MPKPDLAELDVEKLERLEAALSAERARRDDEWRAARVSVGKVARVICAPGETEAGAVERYRTENPDDDSLILLRVFYDAPPLRPDPPPAPVEPIPNPWGEPEPSGPIVYPRTGWL